MTKVFCFQTKYLRYFSQFSKQEHNMSYIYIYIYVCIYVYINKNKLFTNWKLERAVFYQSVKWEVLSDLLSVHWLVSHTILTDARFDTNATRTISWEDGEGSRPSTDYGNIQTICMCLFTAEILIQHRAGRSEDARGLIACRLTCDFSFNHDEADCPSKTHTHTQSHSTIRANYVRINEGHSRSPMRIW